MPFVFIHGVAVRDQSGLAGIERLLREYVAPVFAKDATDAANVPVFSAFWGDLGATFAWNRASLPNGTGAVAAMGAVSDVGATATTLATQDVVPARAAGGGLFAPQGVAPMGPSGAAAASAPTLDADAASDLFAGALAKENAGSESGHAVLERAAESSSYASAAVAVDSAIRELAAQRGTVTLDTATLNAIQALAVARATVPAKSTPADAVAAQGVIDDIGTLIRKAGQRVGGAIQSAQDAVGAATAQALLGIRRPLNSFVTMFTGDVFKYLSSRDETDPDTSIVHRVSAALQDAAAAQRERNGEPLVVLTHSMGGQLMYDAATWYLDRAGAPVDTIVIDFWAAAASQVGLFEEMKFFKASSAAFSAATGKKTPLPPQERLKHWWNVYDPNDFLSYTAAPIFDGVHEARFMSDSSPLQAHGQYLVLPRFYQMFAAELKTALAP